MMLHFWVTRLLKKEKGMKDLIVLLEFFEIPPDLEETKRIVCVTQRAYEHVLLHLCGKTNRNEVIRDVVPVTDIQVFLFGQTEPFDFEVLNGCDKSLSDVLQPQRFAMNELLQDLEILTTFANSIQKKKKKRYVFAPPNGDLYHNQGGGDVVPGDGSMVAFLEFARCLYARMLYYEHTRTTRSTTTVHEKTLYVRGGGQHGTIVWGGVGAILRRHRFEYYAGDSFGAAIAVMAALDPTGERLFFDRVLETCTRMKLDEGDRPLNRDVAIEFVQSSLHEYIDRTLGELDLPVDIMVSNLSYGVEHAILNRSTAPDMKLGDALVASMSIPFIVGEHFGFLDGGLTAWNYVDRLGADCVVVGLGGVVDGTPWDKLRHFGALGDATVGIVEMWRKFSGQCEPLKSPSKPHEHFCIPTRDSNVSILGGSIGTTSWHVLNFQHGFEVVTTSDGDDGV
jgi:predicted acylesterase/phospholipase RssA